MRNIVLFGFMGSGKSAVAKKLQDKLHYTLIEMDQLIEESEQTTINQIFKIKGEPYFRELEKKMVEKISKKNNSIISTGGGVVLDQENIKNLKKNGILISLLASPEIIFQRIKKETHRPLLKTENPLKTISDLLEYRKPFYKKADYLIDTSQLTVEEVVEKILKILKNQHKSVHN